jgi:uncharacterized protein YjbI with pentapeptide repeats
MNIKINIGYKKMTSTEKDLSSFAAFDLDDLLSEISTQNKSKKEVTAYLNRSFVINMIRQYREEALVNKQDSTVDIQIDFTEYNFTGADFRGFKRKDFDLFNFQDCDITAVRLDRIGIDFFREYIIEGKVIFQGINLEQAYLGPVLIKRVELGIECYMYLNLSNINLSGSNFRNANIEGLILENTNISGCDFTNAKNMDLKQFAFTMGFETAIFNEDKKINQEMKDKIKQYSETLDPDSYYSLPSDNPNKFSTYLAAMTNIIDD